MDYNVTVKIIEECGNLFDTVPDKQFTAWNLFTKVNQIVSKYEGLDCLMHVNFANGGVTQGLCVITDWQPCAVVLQSDDGEVPKLRVIYPKDFIAFMEEVQPIFDVQYPAFPEEQED